VAAEEVVEGNEVGIWWETVDAVPPTGAAEQGVEGNEVSVGCLKELVLAGSKSTIGELLEYGACVGGQLWALDIARGEAAMIEQLIRVSSAKPLAKVLECTPLPEKLAGLAVGYLHGVSGIPKRASPGARAKEMAMVLPPPPPLYHHHHLLNPYDYRKGSPQPTHTRRQETAAAAEAEATAAEAEAEAETTPAETTPAETTPAETAPAETTPATRSSNLPLTIVL
jgi:hypothetical protein